MRDEPWMTWTDWPPGVVWAIGFYYGVAVWAVLPAGGVA